MASKSLHGLSKSLRTLRAFTASSKDPLTQCLAPRLARSMATETALPNELPSSFDSSFLRNASDPVSPLPAPTVLTTIYKFPSMEPLRFENYNSKHLHLPLRRDILHRAVVFEGDATRAGTASSKTRYEVHGGHRKIRPQKGMGRARLGTRQSPMLKGGGKSFGPHPRDFSTKLPRKMYDLAWRTALSWRYRRGELIICEDGMDVEYPGFFSEYAEEEEEKIPKTRFAESIFTHNHWGKEDGRSLIISDAYKDGIFEMMELIGGHGRALLEEEVDVKDLLEMGRVIIEKSALDRMLSEHQSDLVPKIKRTVSI